MTRAVIIGNIISLAAAAFTAASAICRGRKKIYGYQAIQCVIMAVASVFFGSMSGIVTFVLCAARNTLAAYDRFDRRACVIFTVLVSVVGIASNNLGITGYIPVLTTVIYTIGSWKLKGEIAIKLNSALNLILWSIYDVIILDLVSLGVDAVCATLTVVSAVKIRKEKRRARS